MEILLSGEEDDSWKEMSDLMFGDVGGHVEKSKEVKGNVVYVDFKKSSKLK